MGWFLGIEILIGLVFVHMTTGHWIRLADGQNKFEGRVEVRYRTIGFWGTICDHGFDIADGSVMCRQLGFPGVHTVHHGNYFTTPRSSVPRWIWLRNLHCTGDEPHLNDCEGDPWRSYSGDCTHEEDAGVVCNACGDPGIPADGKLIGNDRTLGSQVRYECYHGVLEGPDLRVCQEDGSWTGYLPKCVTSDVPISCGDPGDPINGYQTTTDNSIGATKTYACAEGYEMVGQPWRVCQANGEWSGIEPRCEKSQVTTSEMNMGGESGIATGFMNPAMGFGADDPMDPKSNSKSSNNTVLISIAVVGVVLLVVAVTLVMIVLYRKRKSARGRSSKEVRYKAQHLANETYVDVGIIENARDSEGDASSQTEPGVNSNDNGEAVYAEIGEHGHSQAGTLDRAYQPIIEHDKNNYTPLRAESLQHNTDVAAKATDTEISKDLKKKDDGGAVHKAENFYEGIPY
ncbi:uncharacterized protein [Ptychodera flava]|uniref:uncharacterized protein n=1 Tax=Ptychodera flava TaxID=63121 RepID=UPI00396A0E90